MIFLYKDISKNVLKFEKGLRPWGVKESIKFFSVHRVVTDYLFIFNEYFSLSLFKNSNNFIISWNKFWTSKSIRIIMAMLLPWSHSFTFSNVYCDNSEILYIVFFKHIDNFHWKGKHYSEPKEQVPSKNIYYFAHSQIIYSIIWMMTFRSEMV